MDIRILKNWSPTYWSFPKAFQGRDISFPRKGVLFFNLDDFIERGKYRFWLDRCQPIISDVSDGEYYKPMIEKEIQKRKGDLIKTKIKNNPVIQELDKSVSDIEKFIEKLKQATPEELSAIKEILTK